MSNSLDPDQERIVGSGFGPNCLQRLSAGGTGRQTDQLVTVLKHHLKLITFVNGLYQNQTRQYVGPYLDPNCLTLWWYP